MPTPKIYPRWKHRPRCSSYLYYIKPTSWAAEVHEYPDGRIGVACGEERKNFYNLGEAMFYAEKLVALRFNRGDYKESFAPNAAYRQPAFSATNFRDLIY
jgi:hypothetical protein